jgi:hypothetical protein
MMEPDPCHPPEKETAVIHTPVAALLLISSVPVFVALRDALVR